MSFADLLRESRSTPTARLHKFMTDYDPHQSRVYAFVEGSPDSAFYRALIERFLDGTKRLYIYNCEGKKNVYDTFTDVTSRYPGCRNILFFVDKDVDDIVGKVWPTDPRIFVTDTYSIENYLVRQETVARYFEDFVKLRRVFLDLDPVLSKFTQKLAQFQRMVQPLMYWIIVMRRSGVKVVLSDLRLAEIYRYDGTRVVRIRYNHTMDYVRRVTQTEQSPHCWKLMRRLRLELKQQNPKRYTRGKFEAWFLLEFVKQMIDDLRAVVAEGEEDGNISVVTPLHETNFAQLLVRGMPIPLSLESFLRFHLQLQTPPQQPVKTSARLRKLVTGLLGLVRRT